ncbi:MAG: flagellar hook-length control protein FliK [Rhodanobacter sp.]
MTPAIATPIPSHVAAVAPRAGPSEPAGAHARAKNFDNHLDAARQQRKQAPDAQRSSHDSASNTAKPDTTAATPGKTPAAKDNSIVAATVPAVAAAATASVPAVVDPATELAVGTLPWKLTVDASTDEKVETTAPDKDDATTTATLSLAGAMLALLPTAAAILQLGSGGTDAGSRPSTQAITMAGADVDADATPTMLDDTNVAMPVDSATVLLAGKGTSPALTSGVMAALDAGRDPSREQSSISALLAAPAPATSSSVLMLPVSAPVGSPAFGQELGQQVAWLSSQAGQGLKQASIRLHPEELGQLDIKVSVKHDRVDVVFSAQHPAAVTAVQQTLPQLNHLLAQHGLSLGHTEVGQQQDNRARQDSSGGRLRSVTGMADNEDVHGGGVQMTVSRIGLLDAFA